jgi:microsomal dipeptidase-like Zn-dependent dipeptidase
VTRRAPVVAAVVLLVLGLGVGWLARDGERLIDRIEPGPLPEPSERALALHRDARIVDLHADTLLWSRDLLARSEVGHVDLPRLVAGNVALQVFTIVTRVPLGFNPERTPAARPDLITLIAWLHRWPAPARASLFERARWQAGRLAEAAERSDGRLAPIRTRRDLERLLAHRERAGDVVGALLGIEGAHALEGRVENLAPLAEAGVRMIGLAHFFDNEFAGSAHGVEKGGLSDLGRALVREMEARGVLVDLAHVSPSAIDDALALVRKPVVVSHTGVRGTCDGARNLSDDQLRRIAERGGVIGIGYWSVAACGTRPRDVARALAHVVRVAGENHAALGSDWDGATTVGFDASRLAVLTQALVEEGLSDAAIRRILGENALRVLFATLPER